MLGYLKRDADRFLPFVEGLYFDMDAFCKAEVEPMDKECEHIHIIALTEYLGLIIRIAYLDGRYDFFFFLTLFPIIRKLLMLAIADPLIPTLVFPLLHFLILPVGLLLHLLRSLK